MAIGAVVALTAFVIGTCVTLLSFEYVPAKVTLCQLARSPEFYRGRMVTIETDIRNTLIEDGNCASPDAWANISLTESYVPAADVQKLFSEPEINYFYSARILVTGRFDPDATLACFGPKAAVRATNIELKSGITVEEHPLRFVD